MQRRFVPAVNVILYLTLLTISDRIGENYPWNNYYDFMDWLTRQSQIRQQKLEFRMKISLP